MDQEFKARWVAALRSGEYKQGHGMLVNDCRGGEKYFCCLGVACELAVEDGLLERSANSSFHDGYKVGWNIENGRLPDSLAAHLGLSAVGHLSSPVDGYDALTSLNDDAGWTFAQIADYIETNF